MERPAFDKHRLVSFLRKLRSDAEYGLKCVQHEKSSAKLNADIVQSLQTVYRQTTRQLEQLGHPQPFKE